MTQAEDYPPSWKENCDAVLKKLVADLGIPNTFTGLDMAAGDSDYISDAAINAGNTWNAPSMQTLLVIGGGCDGQWVDIADGRNSIDIAFQVETRSVAYKPPFSEDPTSHVSFQTEVYFRRKFKCEGHLFEYLVPARDRDLHDGSHYAASIIAKLTAGYRQSLADGRYAKPNDHGVTSMIGKQLRDSESRNADLKTEILVLQDVERDLRQRLAEANTRANTTMDVRHPFTDGPNRKIVTAKEASR